MEAPSDEEDANGGDDDPEGADGLTPGEGEDGETGGTEDGDDGPKERSKGRGAGFHGRG